MKQLAIKSFIEGNPQWRLEDDVLIGDWQFRDFSVLSQVISAICEISKELDHHPAVTFGYNTLHVELTTHDAGNIITEKDLEFAKICTDYIHKNDH